jgi:hypothetical protein
VGKEIFLRLQAAAAAKRIKLPQSTNHQILEAKAPPLPRWMDYDRTPLPPPIVEQPIVDSQPPPDTKTDEQDQVMKHQNYHLPQQHEEPSIPPTSVVVVSPKLEGTFVQRDQLIREKGRQYALDQWKQQNSAKLVAAPPTQIQKKIEGDNVTVISALSEQSSFTVETKGAHSRPKAAKIIINDIGESAEEEKNRRLQKFEMIKRKKANEAAEREKVCLPRTSL